MSVRLGILGFAHGHVGIYCGQWTKMPADVVQIVAGWDHDAARLKQSAEQWKFAPVQSAAALVARDDIDGVVIAAETSMHAELTELAAAAGKHIVVQKPLALTLAEADRMIAAVKRSGVRFSLAWQMRVDPQNLEMKRMIKDGTLGRVYMIRRRHCLPTQVWPDFDQKWHVKPELNRGMWADDAAHAIDFIYWIFGMPRSVMAELDTLRNPRIPDDNGIAIFRYADGLFAEVSCSFVATVGENTTEIVAENGVVIQNYGDLVSCTIARPADAVGLRWYNNAAKAWINGQAASPANHGVRLAALAMPIVDFIAGRREAIATVEEGRDVLAMTDACYQSAAAGKRTEF